MGCNPRRLSFRCPRKLRDVIGSDNGRYMKACPVFHVYLEPFAESRVYLCRHDLGHGIMMTGPTKKTRHPTQFQGAQVEPASPQSRSTH
ncbi:hypothetical protein M378DRAFT_279725 [Amanita muscaria Koide BX008]|uniref:Uncharacterized protein n=1 Tax=Amanita muscaria (strain Koide BX008) TaxID=946122 RepID=A0A0C2RUA9_AMAMK|nr:hypothetical protein M378DRAFT_279725 [Amanita muscaria Koide BX008]